MRPSKPMGKGRPPEVLETRALEIAPVSITFLGINKELSSLTVCWLLSKLVVPRQKKTNIATHLEVPILNVVDSNALSMNRLLPGRIEWIVCYARLLKAYWALFAAGFTSIISFGRTKRAGGRICRTNGLGIAFTTLPRRGRIPQGVLPRRLFCYCRWSTCHLFLGVSCDILRSHLWLFSLALSSE